ncbi:hypothetical protein D9611_010672 [Ephemerocybe angulata]|uniref:Ubiquitin-like domain-containing protein n=1 Tax=Ephemerocybe angulata TaxID=980116 RepID=A0A8H5BC16_9AGAR|nr:hypothetical protein D9611_010672 [Tulosesus angulatus]
MSENPGSRLLNVSHVHLLVQIRSDCYMIPLKSSLLLPPSAPSPTRALQMDPSGPLTRYSSPPTQLFQQFFAGASSFSVYGGHFHAIGGDYVDSRTVSNLNADELERLLAQLRQVELAYRSIAQHVGYTSVNGVTIIDALDERIILPPSLVAEFEDVHYFLLKHFRGVLGEELVAEREYCIARQHDGQLVRPEDWKSVLEAGEVVVMSMLIEKVWVESVKDTCPKCGRTRLGTYREGGWFKCDRRFIELTLYVVPYEAYILVADRSALLISRVMYVIFHRRRTFISLTAPFTCSLVRTSFLHLKCTFFSLNATSCSCSEVRDPSASLPSRSYDLPPLQPFISITDHSVLLLPSPMYVDISPEVYIQLADRSVVLLPSPLYVLVFLSCASTSLTSLCLYTLALGTQLRSITPLTLSLSHRNLLSSLSVVLKSKRSQDVLEEIVETRSYGDYFPSSDEEIVEGSSDEECVLTSKRSEVHNTVHG